MKPNKVSPTKRPKGSVYLIAFVALVVVAAIFAGCTSNENKPVEPTPTVKTSPSPSPSPSPTVAPEPGDTIIVIKDGSVDIKVDKTLCGDDDGTTTSDDKKFKCMYKLGDVEIRKATGAPTHPPTNENSKITVNAGDELITIKGNGDHVKIDFKKTKYPLCTDGVAGHHCGTNHVVTVKVDSSTTSCAATDRCEVRVKRKAY
jgi:hypothetical protein